MPPQAKPKRVRPLVPAAERRGVAPGKRENDVPAGRRCKRCPGSSEPHFVSHPSLAWRNAEERYGSAQAPADDPAYGQAHMPDEVTRDLARRMHYAAYRWQQAPPEEARRWQGDYYALRDRIVLGNRKLIF